MLSRTLFITLDRLKPQTFIQAVKLRAVLDATVCLQLRKTLDGLGLGHLPVYYEFSESNLNAIPFITEGVEEFIDLNELQSVNYLLQRNIEQILEEFNLFFKYNPNTVLNFTAGIFSKGNFVLTADVLGKD